MKKLEPQSESISDSHAPTKVSGHWTESVVALSSSTLRKVSPVSFSELELKHYSAFRILFVEKLFVEEEDDKSRFPFFQRSSFEIQRVVDKSRIIKIVLLSSNKIT